MQRTDDTYLLILNAMFVNYWQVPEWLGGLCVLPNSITSSFEEAVDLNA